MTYEILILIFTAISIGFFHTLFGPDHYLPFIFLAKARNWSLVKTTYITLLCGLGHITSAVLLGLVGIALGLSVGKLEFIEHFRGDLAVWLLITFGLVYFVWGLKKALKCKSPIYNNNSTYKQELKLSKNFTQYYKKQDSNLTPWILFTIFVFGACEPVIPLIIYPASQGYFLNVILVTIFFSASTIITMLTIVLLSIKGLNFLPIKKLENYSHALAGAVILICGITIYYFH